jgi:DNA-binding MarR family transcriptional regulator
LKALEASPIAMTGKPPPPPRPLTERQREVLSAIETFIEKHSFPPTERELAEVLGCHYRSIPDVVKPLEKKGYVEQRRTLDGRVIARTLRVLRSAP